MQFLDKVVLERAGVNIDKVVDVPVIMQLSAAAGEYIDKVVGVPVVMRRRSLHASSTKACGRKFSPHSTCGAGLSGNLGHHFYEPLVPAVLPAVHSSVHGSFWTNFTAFSFEKVDSDPEVDPQALPRAVRTKKPGQFFLRWVRRVFSPFQGHFSDSVQLNVESRRSSDLSPR